MTDTLGFAELEDVFREVRKDLETHIRRRVRCPETAADLTQDLYLRLSRIAGRLPNRHEARLYLFRMASNIANDHHKLNAGRRRILEGLVPLFDRPEVTAEEVVTHRDALRQVETVVSELPNRQQKIFRMSRIDGLTHAEIARSLGISVSLVEKEIIAAMQHTLARVRRD